MGFEVNSEAASIMKGLGFSINTKKIQRGVCNWGILPPKADACQECAVEHKPDEPHDKTSLYYQYYFRAKHGRWPTWEDAMAHCDDATKKSWREELARAGEIEETQNG